MNKNRNYLTQAFEVETDTNVSTDFEPAISIDVTSRIVSNIATLQQAMGIAALEPMAEGSIVKRYKTTVTKGANAQVAEGEVIALSKTERKPLTDVVLKLNKYRRLTTAEAIQRSGRDVAINAADNALIGEIRKDIKKSFFDMVKAGKGTADGGQTLQMACAQAWGSVQSYFEDTDTTPVFFLNPLDVATHLGNAQITTQEAFGFSYIQNFLGMGNAFVSAMVEKGKVFATAGENLHCAYVPASGDVAGAFGLTYDESGLVGMTHTVAADRASIQTLALSGVIFYPEDESGVFKSAINGMA